MACDAPCALGCVIRALVRLICTPLSLMVVVELKPRTALERVAAAATARLDMEVARSVELSIFSLSFSLLCAERRVAEWESPKDRASRLITRCLAACLGSSDELSW